MVHITVYSDYVCPFCFIAEHALQEAIPTHDIQVRWMPYELHPQPQPTPELERPELRRIWVQEVYPLAEQFGIAIQLPSISPQPHTGLACEGFQFAQEQGKGDVYHRAVLEAFFQEDRDIGKPAVLAQIAAEIGLNILQFETVLQTRHYRAAHQQALQQARDAGIAAVPTFVVGDQVFAGLRTAKELESAIRAATGANDRISLTAF